MRILLIHNPAAGNGDQTEDSLVKVLRDAGHKVAYQSSKKEKWQKVLKDASDLVVAAGGDGTVDKVARAMNGKSPPLAILPLGTANNVASSFGISMRLRDAIDQWKSARPRTLDFWTARGPWGEQEIVESSGLGAIADNGLAMNAAAPEATDKRSKLTLSRSVLHGLVRKIDPFELCARGKGETVDGEFLLFDILNIGMTGPRLHLLAGADPSDGLLDIAFVRPDKRGEFCKWLDSGAEQPWRERSSLRCDKIHVEWSGRRLRLGDGEFWPAEDEEIEDGWLELEHADRTIEVMAPRAG